MQLSHNILLAMALFGMTGVASAEVYETRDAQGNPVFSDAPSADAVRIDVLPSNVADAVEVHEHPQSVPAPADQENQQPSYPGSSVVYESEQRHEVGDENLQRREVGDEDLQRHEVGDEDLQRHEVGDEGLQRHEVGDEGLQRHEVGDEDLHRHEVGDDTVEHSHDDGDDDHQHTVQGYDGTGTVNQRHIRIRGHRFR